jgi:cyclic pyranopterin phosphate synthase
LEFSHLNEKGKVKMVDISDKTIVSRTATASGKVYLQQNTIELLKNNQIQKGDAIAVVKTAGIMGAKKTCDLIPLCHLIPLNNVELDIQFKGGFVEITGTVKAHNRTGVEMEALTSVAVAALTLYDMCKALDKTMRISDIVLLEKKKESL